jgi:hypothetical protein
MTGCSEADWVTMIACASRHTAIATQASTFTRVKYSHPSLNPYPKVWVIVWVFWEAIGGDLSSWEPGKVWMYGPGL